MKGFVIDVIIILEKGDIIDEVGRCIGPRHNKHTIYNLR